MYPAVVKFNEINSNYKHTCKIHRLTFVYLYCSIRISYLKWVPINRFNPVISLCLSQVRTWNFQYHVAWSFRVQWVQFRWNVIVRFVDIGGFDDASLFRLSFRNYHPIKIHDTCIMCKDNNITLLLLIDLLLLFNVTSVICQLFWWQTYMHVGKKCRHNGK